MTSLATGTMRIMMIFSFKPTNPMTHGRPNGDGPDLFLTSRWDLASTVLLRMASKKSNPSKQPINLQPPTSNQPPIPSYGFGLRGQLAGWASAKVALLPLEASNAAVALNTKALEAQGGGDADLELDGQNDEHVGGGWIWCCAWGVPCVKNGDLRWFEMTRWWNIVESSNHQQWIEQKTWAGQRTRLGSSGTSMEM